MPRERAKINIEPRVRWRAATSSGDGDHGQRGELGLGTSSANRIGRKARETMASEFLIFDRMPGLPPLGRGPRLTQILAPRC